MKKVKQLVCFDWAIKKMLREQDNFDILEGFLSELLSDNIKIKQIFDSESNKETEDDEHSQVDILVENGNNELVIIKIHNTREDDISYHMLYDTSKAVAEQTKGGEPYASAKKIISITITYFDLEQGNDYVFYGTTNFRGVRKNDILDLSTKGKETHSQENLAQIFPEYWLVKVGKFGNKIKNKLDEWVYFLKNNEIREDFTAQGLVQAREKLDELKMSKTERKTYQRYLKKLRELSGEQQTQVTGVEEWLQKGEEIGMEKKGIAIAKNLKQMGFAISDIAKATGLTEEEVEKL